MSDRKREGCVYQLSFPGKTDKTYIGVDTIRADGGLRFGGHLRAANCGSTTLLHKAIRRFGAPVKTVLFCSSDLDELFDTEILLIAQNRTKAPFGLNMTCGGDGRHVSRDARERLRRERAAREAEEREQRAIEAEKLRRRAKASVTMKELRARERQRVDEVVQRQLRGECPIWNRIAARSNARPGSSRTG